MDGCFIVVDDCCCSLFELDARTLSFVLDSTPPMNQPP